jgi:anthranilate synthase/aminodeoxychorismate synthase-like glutamine amidotransferase|tara:strand:+ start:1671 stop:2228 length:558 start_codon:yes stop_codon:yes gene_type:complete
MIYLIDHEDSFTYNLAHLLDSIEPTIVSNYYEINYKKLRKASTIVLSPGPGEPKDYPLTSEVYKKYKGKKKILGICLGFQHIVHSEGGKIVQQKNILHGYQSRIKIISDKSIFKKNADLLGGRYHSLKLEEPFISKSMTITMRCAKTNVAMAIEDDMNQVYGFQFHPDSFLTPNGKYLIKKIISR